MRKREAWSKQPNESLGEYRHRLRLMVFAHYCGGINKIRCQCLGCRVKGIRYTCFLEIDHIDGRKPKQSSKKGARLKGYDLVAFLVRAGFPPGYSIKCSCCNKQKGGGSRNPRQGRCPFYASKH